MNKIEIFGHGKVVKSFLNLISNNQSIALFEKDASFERVHEHVFLCASVNEEQVLQKSFDPYNRLSVALPNLRLVNSLIAKGCFNEGNVFVLTNPSEVVAEYIYRKTGNKRIFALGLEADALRLANIMGVLTEELLLGGNHYDRPCGYFIKLDSDMSENYEILNEKLKESIKMEFSGNYPPTTNGGLVLKKAYEVIQLGGSMRCSAFVEELDCFSGGILSFPFMNFTPFLGNTSLSKNFIMDVIEKHKNTFSSFMQELS